jgi:hypothetical protein
MQPQNTLVGSAATAQRVVPLLQALSRLEDNVSALAVRLDPVTNHVPQSDQNSLVSPSVTGRLQTLSVTLEYLLDNIEL